MEFGDALKAAREDAGLSHEELARRIDKSVGLLSMYETGQRFPPQTTLEAIEREVKINLRAIWEKYKPEWDRLMRERREQRDAEQNNHQILPPSDSSQQLIAAMLNDGHIKDLSEEDRARLARLINKHLPTIQKEKARRNKKKSPGRPPE